MKRLIALTLILIFMFVLIAGSCENVAPKDHSSDEKSGDHVEQSHINDIDIGDKEYDTIRIAVTEDMADAFGVETESQSLISNAVNKRNELIESRFSTKIEVSVVDPNDEIARMKAGIASGETYDYDLICFPATTLAVMVESGLLTNLLSLDSFNADSVYYEDSGASSMVVGDTLYFLYDAATMYYDGLWVIYADTELLESTGLPNPASLVLEGDWTWDQFIIYSEKIAEGIMNKSSVDYKLDTFGYAAFDMEYDLPLAMWTSCGIDILRPGTFELSDDYDTMTTALRKMRTIYESRSRFADTSDKKLSKEAFNEGRVGFYFDTLSYAANIKERDREWMVLPMPKASSDSERAYSHISSDSHAFAVPANTSRSTSELSAILRVICGASGDSLIEAVRDKYVYLCFTNNYSTVMIENILKTAKFDISNVYAASYEKIDLVTSLACVNVIREADDIKTQLTNSRSLNAFNPLIARLFGANE